MSSTSLKVESLTVRAQSLTIGPMHRDILKAKVVNLENSLEKSKNQLETEAEEFRNLHNLKDPQAQEAYRNLRLEQQAQLDKEYQRQQDNITQLYERFQREWSNDPREKVVPVRGENLRGESSFLAQSLGTALQLALAEVVVRRPVDPIEYLAHWLYQHSENMKRQQQRAIEDFLLTLSRDEAAAAMEQRRIVQREKRLIKGEEERRKAIFIQRSTDDVTTTTTSTDSSDVTADKNTEQETDLQEVTPKVPLYTITEAEASDATSEQEVRSVNSDKAEMDKAEMDTSQEAAANTEIMPSSAQIEVSVTYEP